MNVRKKIRALAGALLSTTFALTLASTLALTLSACSNSHDNNDGKSEAKVRVLHASPDAPAVDVFVNDKAIATNAPFKAATAFSTVNAGRGSVKVNPTGNSASVINATPDFNKNRSYTIIAANKVAAIEPLVIDDDGVAPATGQVKVRVVHAAPSAPAVDIYVTAPAAALAGTTPTLANVPFKTISSVLQIAAGSYQIRVAVAGSKAPVFDSGSVTLTGGSDLVLVAVDQSSGNSPISLIGLTADPATPKIELNDISAKLRVMHASPDAPNVDVLLDNAVALSNVPYPANSDFLAVPSGARNVKVNAAGTTSTVINVTPTLAAGKAYTAYAVGFLAGISPLLVEDNLAPAAGNNAKIRVIHGSPDAPNVDVLANNAVALSNVPFKTASDYLTVPAGAYNFKINVAGTANTATQADVTLVAGRVYTAIAIGSVATSATNKLTIKLLTDR
jgi:Domain of unknown function (DUF4397)